MTTEVFSNQVHRPPPPNAPRPKGILKNSYRCESPATSPTVLENTKQAKELTIANTQRNAGQRRSSAAARSRGTRSRTPSVLSVDEDETSQRLKWDEANLYLAEQDRTATMKINEPKTPYAKHYDPAEDPSDDEVAEPMDPDDIDVDRFDALNKGSHESGGGKNLDEIPGLSLGEPEEAVPEQNHYQGHHRAVHVDEHKATQNVEEDYLVGLSGEEREKHRKFEQMRKKHYEMKNVAALLGHADKLEDEDEDENEDEDEARVPPMPPLTGRASNWASSGAVGRDA